MDFSPTRIFAPAFTALRTSSSHTKGTGTAGIPVPRVRRVRQVSRVPQVPRVPKVWRMPKVWRRCRVTRGRHRYVG